MFTSPEIQTVNVKIHTYVHSSRPDIFPDNDEKHIV